MDFNILPNIMKYTNTIFFIIIIILLNRYLKLKIMPYRENKMKKLDPSEIEYNTGDVVFFQNDALLYYNGKNGYNFDVHIVKNCLKTLYYYIYPYSHVGIIITINNVPYLLHMTADLQYDLYTKKYVMGVPVLVDMKEFSMYRGHSYIYKLKNTTKVSSDKLLNYIYSSNLKIKGNLFKILKTTVLKIGKYEKDRGTCCDLVKKALYYINECDNTTPADINDIVKILEKNKHYDAPIMIKNGYYKATRDNI